MSEEETEDTSLDGSGAKYRSVTLGTGGLEAATSAWSGESGWYLSKDVGTGPLLDLEGKLNPLETSISGTRSAVPPLPVFIHRCTSMEVSDPSALQVVADLLAQRPAVDVDFIPQQHKIKALAYSPSGESCSFRIYLYHSGLTTGRGSYVMEFQRRDGCPILFREVYAGILHSISSQEREISTVEARPAGQVVPTVVSCDKDAVLGFLACAQRAVPNSHDQLDAIRALATCSEKSGDVLLRSAEAVPFLCGRIKSGCEEMVRLSATTLANMLTPFSFSKIPDTISELLQRHQVASILRAGMQGSGGTSRKRRLEDSETQRQFLRCMRGMGVDVSQWG